MMKIIADKQTKLYELTFLLPADFTDSQQTTLLAELGQLVTKYKGQVVAAQAWGKKDLAYKIKHQGKFHSQAVYTHQVLKFSPDKVQAFEKELLLNEILLRHLLVIADNQDEKQATMMASIT